MVVFLGNLHESDLDPRIRILKVIDHGSVDGGFLRLTGYLQDNLGLSVLARFRALALRRRTGCDQQRRRDQNGDGPTHSNLQCVSEERTLRY